MTMKPNAAAALGTDSDPDQDGDDDSAQQNTFFLPPDFLNGKKYKAGDTIELSVIGEDEDGDTEVTLAGSDDGNNPDWREDLKSTMAAAGDQNLGQ